MSMYALNKSRLGAPLLSALLVASVTLGAASGFTAPAWAQTSPEATRNYNQGIEAYNQGRLPDALKKFDRATQLDPAYADAYYNMGSIFYQMKRYEDSREMFQKSVNLNPTDGQAKYNLGLSLEKLMRLEEAVNVFAQIPPSDPKAAQAKAKLDELRPALRAANNTSANPVVKPKPATSPSAKLAAIPFSKGYDGPTGIVIGPGGFMYVANYSKNVIYRVGAGGEKSVFAQGEGLKGPIGLAYNPKTNELYAANYLLNSVARITATGKVGTLVSGLNKPYNLFMDTVNNALYISEQDPANQVSRVALPN
jgi:tetratricopeptide (TPR) repeat protein